VSPRLIDVLIASSIIAEMLSNLESLNERFICLTPGKRRPNIQTESAPHWLGRKRSPDEVYAEAVRVFSEQELVDLNLAVMSINSWNRLSIAFRYEPERE
jgi:hypothetical protein